MAKTSLDFDGHAARAPRLSLRRQRAIAARARLRVATRAALPALNGAPLPRRFCDGKQRRSPLQNGFSRRRRAHSANRRSSTTLRVAPAKTLSAHEWRCQ